MKLNNTKRDQFFYRLVSIHLRSGHQQITIRSLPLVTMPTNRDVQISGLIVILLGLVIELKHKLILLAVQLSQLAEDHVQLRRRIRIRNPYYRESPYYGRNMSANLSQLYGNMPRLRYFSPYEIHEDEGKDDGTEFKVPNRDIRELECTETELEGLAENELCCICKTRRRRVAAIPCGHRSYCVRCSREYKSTAPSTRRCAVCRKTMTSLIVIHDT